MSPDLPGNEPPLPRPGGMEAASVLELVQLFEAGGLRVWLDGGWGVDALLGAQTRPHEDLDIALQEKDLPLLRSSLEGRGYRDVPRDDTRPWNFVLGDPDGRLVDVHAFVFDAAGNGIYGPAENGDQFPAASLLGRGVIQGVAVDCIAAEYIVQFHTGYAVDENDFKDVSALCERFGIEIPKDYERFLKR
jgi:lincosamide nucleotidyltransferase A/C/D/E